MVFPAAGSPVISSVTPPCGFPAVVDFLDVDDLKKNLQSVSRLPGCQLGDRARQIPDLDARYWYAKCDIWHNSKAWRGAVISVN